MGDTEAAEGSQRGLNREAEAEAGEGEGAGQGDEDQRMKEEESVVSEAPQEHCSQ